MKPGQPSSTALLIARSTVFMGQHPQYQQHVDPQTLALCQRFLKDHARWPAFAQFLLRRSFYRRWLQWLERKTLPGIQLHYLVRKKKIESLVRECLDRGFDAVCIIGGGFDTLAWRLAAEYPQAAFTEVDHPDTQAAKQASLSRFARIRENLLFQSADLNRQAVESTLVNPSGGKRLVVVIEGVLMYLPKADVEQLFAQLNSTGVAELRVMFTFMNPDAEGKVRFHDASPRVERWLQRRREPFQWGARPDELGFLMKNQGFQLRNHLGHEELAAEYSSVIGDEILAKGERIAIADRAGADPIETGPAGTQ